MANRNAVLNTKLLSLRALYVIVTMGCNVACPPLPAKHREDWGLDDPSGKSDEEFIRVAKIIEEKVKDLANRIKNGQIDIELVP